MHQYSRRQTFSLNNTNTTLFSSKNSSWNHRDPNHVRNLQEAAKDPKKFEEFVRRMSEESNLNQSLSGSQQHAKRKMHHYSTVSVHTNRNCESQSKRNHSSIDRKSGYVPIEQWEEEQKDIMKKMSWEQRVQFDGQRYGDGYKQNEILRKNLKAF